LTAVGNDPVEAKIAGFLGEYMPEIAAQLRDARQGLRAGFTHGFELVFNNYNALVFGISATERASDAFISVAGYPRWLTLFFRDGAELQDPAGLLEGDGKQVRGIRLTSAADIGTGRVQALIEQAMRPQAARLLAAPPLTTIIKQVAAKRRARRPAALGPNWR
jgi:hypothetical protein